MGESSVKVKQTHISVLDGWRAVSILLVLFGHWFPMPRVTQINGMAGAAGMALFFALSGFLITRMLLQDQQILPFLVRRVFRILPLAWAAMLILIVTTGASTDVAFTNLLFISNLPPAKLMYGGEHLWSLCVEMQFYFGVAVLVGLGGRRALYLLPLGALAVTAARIGASETISIYTYHRIDEIMAGSTVALIVHHIPTTRERAPLPNWLPIILFLTLLVCSHEAAGALQYVRPYAAGATVLCSIYAAPSLFKEALQTRPARYIAEISYALYVIHGMLTVTWLGGQDAPKLVQYALRLPLTIVTFGLAHLSTFHYERYWMTMGRNLSGRLKGRRGPPPLGERTSDKGAV